MSCKQTKKMLILCYWIATNILKNNIRCYIIVLAYTCFLKEGSLFPTRVVYLVNLIASLDDDDDYYYQY
jgi:hypothetical protein